MGPFFGPKNGDAKMQNLQSQHVFGIENWGEALVPALMLLNFWNSKMVALQNAIVDQTRSLFARIPKKWVSSVQEKVSIVPILYPYNHSNIGRLTCDCAARKRLVKYICTARGFLYHWFWSLLHTRISVCWKHDLQMEDYDLVRCVSTNARFVIYL